MVIQGARDGNLGHSGDK